MIEKTVIPLKFTDYIQYVKRGIDRWLANGFLDRDLMTTVPQPSRICGLVSQMRLLLLRVLSNAKRVKRSKHRGLSEKI
jgi:hypothetical protein